jgi:hypothetical protein
VAIAKTKTVTAQKAARVVEAIALVLPIRPVLSSTRWTQETMLRSARLITYRDPNQSVTENARNIAVQMRAEVTLSALPDSDRRSR